MAAIETSLARAESPFHVDKKSNRGNGCSNHVAVFESGFVLHC